MYVCHVKPSKYSIIIVPANYIIYIMYATIVDIMHCLYNTVKLY